MAKKNKKQAKEPKLRPLSTLEIVQARFLMKSEICCNLLACMTQSGLTFEQIAERIQLTPSELESLFESPGDMLLETISDISFACGYEVRFLAGGLLDADR